jgi:hypothetical protein
MAEAMTRATEDAGHEGHLLETSGDPAAFDTAGKAAVQEAITRYRDGGAIADPAVLAWLTVALTSLPVRDDAWARMVPEYKDAHVRLWTDVTRHARPGWAAAPASLLAFVAWQSGEGALGVIAVERALADTRGYSMAVLISDALHAGLPPSAAVLQMTPDEVAASYQGHHQQP